MSSFSFIIATALEAQADAILEAAEAGKMNMPSGEYLRMSNEAKAIWQQAQDLKGTKFIDIFKTHLQYNYFV